MNLISYTQYWYSTTEVIIILQHSVLIEQLIRKLPFHICRNAVHHIVSPNSNFEYQKFCPIKRQCNIIIRIFKKTILMGPKTWKISKFGFWRKRVVNTSINQSNRNKGNNLCKRERCDWFCVLCTLCESPEI